MLFDFSPFFMFLSLFYIFFSVCLNQFLDGLHLFGREFFFDFKESTLQYLKKIQIQIVLKKTVVKISAISNSKSPSWSLVTIRCEFFLVNISRTVRWILLGLILNDKIIKKHLVFTITHICTFARCVFINKNLIIWNMKKVKNEWCQSMMLKMFYLNRFVRWTNCIWWAVE